MEARSRPNKEVSFWEYEEEMEAQERSLLKAKVAGLIAKKEYENKLKKMKVPIYGNLRMRGKATNCIRMMSVNINGMSMTKRGNNKADRLQQLISQYQLDAVGIQEACVNWGKYKAFNRFAARGYDSIRGGPISQYSQELHGDWQDPERWHRDSPAGLILQVCKEDQQVNRHGSHWVRPMVLVYNERRAWGEDENCHGVRSG